MTIANNIHGCNKLRNGSDASDTDNSTKCSTNIIPSKIFGTAKMALIYCGSVGQYMRTGTPENYIYTTVFESEHELCYAHLRAAPVVQQSPVYDYGHGY